MLKKLLLGGVMVIFVLGLLPLSASACSSELKAGSLIKAGNNSVYYFGADNKRYVFPNEKTYKTWFVSFNTIITISNELLGEIPIGGNVTYKPGKKLVKITTDPKVYYVDKAGTLRHVSSEALAKELWGTTWYKLVDDIPDPFFVNYKIGQPLEEPELPTVEAAYSINQDKTLSDQPDPTGDQLSAINLSGKYDSSLGKVLLNWSVTGMSAPKGYKVVRSASPSPVYPGNEYHYLSDPKARSDKWAGLSSGNHYFRVCEYLEGKCGIYSNEIIVNVPGTTADNSNGSIELIGSWNSDKNKVILQWKPINLYSAKGFKVVKSTTANPVYPGNEYHYLSDPAARSDAWTGLQAGTYHFRVCEYLGGSCGKYSNDVTVTVPGAVADNSNGSITLSGSYDANKDKVILNWSLKDMYSSKGFKVVYSTQANPVYPGNEYHYLSSPDARSDKWTGLAPGTYHFRVCEYLSGSCGIYSNDTTVTVQ